MKRRFKRVSFAIDEKAYDIWNTAAENLIKEGYFRNRADIFDHLAYFMFSLSEAQGEAQGTEVDLIENIRKRKTDILRKKNLKLN